MNATSPPLKRATRITQRGKDRCDQLVKIASRRFLAHGYDGVSVDEIVKEIGGSKTNVYNHFGNKEGLFIAVVEGLCDEHVSQLQTLHITTGSLEEGLHLLMKAFAKIILAPKQVAFHRLIVAESARFPKAGKVWFERGPVASRSVFQRLLEEQKRKGNIVTDKNIEQIAAQIHGAMVYQLLTCTVMLGTPPSKKEVANMIDTLADMAISTLTQ
jgi:AcrR family transcriptional regulator